MPSPVIAIAASSTAALAAGALVATILIVPAEPSDDRVWFDVPLSGTTLVTGDIPLDLHGTGRSLVTQLRVQVARDGSDVASLTDSSPEVSRYGPIDAVLGAGHLTWISPAPGSYSLTPYVLTDKSWVQGVPVSVTVVAEADAPVIAPTTPSATPGVAPTTTPSAPATAPATTPASPTTPATQAPPVSGPSPTTTPPSAPTGTITQTTVPGHPGDPTYSNFRVAYTPVAAFVDIQIQVVRSGTARSNNGSWQSVGCSAPAVLFGTAVCSTDPAVYVAPQTYDQWVHYRARITANGQTITVYPTATPAYWLVPLTIR